MNITDIYPTDSCYYYTACHGTVRYTESEVAFGKLDLNGNIIFQYTYQQGDSANFPNRTYAQMDSNFRGNFIIAHSYIGVDGWFPRLMEIDLTGSIVNDFLLDFTSPDSVSMGDNILMNIESVDSTYDIVAEYIYRNKDNNPPGPEYSRGAIILKIDQFGDTIWTKRYHSAQSLNGQTRYSPIVFTPINDTVNLLICRESLFYSSLFQASNNWSKTHFLWLNKEGGILETKTMQHTPVCFGGSSFIPLTDSSMIYVYDDSYLVPYSPTVDVFEYYSLIARLDKNLNPLWKDSLYEKPTSNIGQALTIKKIVPAGDSSFIYAYGRTSYFQDSISNQYTVYTRITKQKISGETEWSRNFYYYPDSTIGVVPPTYQIFDVEVTKDKGCIVAGTIISPDSAAAQVPSEFGYIIKTNCLGFIGSPSAGLQHQNLGKMEVQFVNTSTEAGSFDWYFGDGSHSTVGEEQDTLTHHYQTFGPHYGMLIAHGCDGETDTIQFEVNPIYHFDPSPVTEDQDYFAIFPNPVLSGNYLFIYLNNLNPSIDNINLRIYSIDNKLIDHFSLEAKEGNHALHTSLGAGMYYSILYNGNELLQKRKFIVL